MKYSILIRTKNSESTIKNCLLSIFEQSLQPEEIIIIDSGSSDNTLEVVSEFNTEIIYYPPELPFNYSKALNLGLAQISTECVLILSSHVQLVNNIQIELMYQFLKEDDNCVAVSSLRGASLEINPKTTLKFEKIFLSNFKGRAMYNFCSLFRISSWKQYQFNEDIPTCEDQEWSLQFLKRRFYTVVITSPKIYYNNPYYNLRKDLNETIALGEFVYPKMLSNGYIKQLIRKGIEDFKVKNTNPGLIKMYLALGLFRHKYIKRYNLKSIYSKHLE